jgi:tetratricopeptide (TPR) repeat protein
VAASFNNLGEVYRIQGKYEKALEYYHKALEIDIKVSGQHYLNVAGQPREHLQCS